MGAYFQNYYPHLLNEYLSARQNIWHNPDHSMIKLGIIAENMTKEVVRHYNLPLSENTQLYRLNTLSQYGLLSDDIASAFHDIRRFRNQASHEGYVNAQDVANLFTWMDSLVAWFENMMQVQHRPVYQKPHSTYGIFGIPVEIYVFVGFPILFFGSLIYSYIMNQVIKYWPYIAVFAVLGIIVIMRIRSGKWPFWVSKLANKLKSVFLNKS